MLYLLYIYVLRNFDMNITFLQLSSRNNTLRYTSLIGTSWSFITLMSLLTDFRHKKLTYREWVPYDYSSYVTYCITYTQQILSTFHTASVNVACDTLLCGFLMHICCQIEILEYRLKNILSDQITLGYCVYHHNRILQLVTILMMEIYIIQHCYVYCLTMNENYDKNYILFSNFFSYFFLFIFYSNFL